MDVRTLLGRSAHFYAQREAIIDGTRRISFLEAWDRGIRFANGLLALGLKPQDRVGVLEDNCLETADAYLGLAIANLVRVPLYAGSSFEVHFHMLEHTNCSALVANPNRLEEVAGIQESIGGLEHLVVRDEGYEKWLLAQSNEIPEICIHPDDWFIIRHSGGTSGLPKGIGITHRRWIISMRDWFFPLPPVIPGDTFLHVSPMSHASGYMFLPVWAAGGRNIMHSSFEPATCMQTMEQEKVNYLFVAPSDLNKLTRSGSSKTPADWPYLKALMSGGAPISSKVIQSIRNVFGDVLYQSYGQTEVGIVSIGSPSQWKMKSPTGSNPVLACGIPLHFVDLKIMDGSKSQPLGEAGEIVVRTDGMMDDYWGHEKKTDLEPEKWIHTGDMGKLDPNGFLYILGRKEDLIISGGTKIYPLQLENLICAHPDILEAAVVGAPHPEFGEVAVAYCVVNEHSALTGQEIQSLCREQINFGQAPFYVKITTESLPKNNIGKVIRRSLQTLDDNFTAARLRR
ncbi:MAG TPA: class I adenylate-forming enzyme family protein [Bacillota bacterium]|nr:class I adenylate-forming enzyme family protein [Bacillota bacterium]